MKGFDTLMLRVGTGEQALNHRLVAINDCTDTFEVSVEWTESIPVAFQRHMAIVPTAARVTDANTVGDHNGTFAIDYK